MTYFISLTNCGIRDNPSLARRMISVIPASLNLNLNLNLDMQVPALEVIYTNEGVWVLLDDSTRHNWLLVEKHGYDPMCVPNDCHIYRSLFPRGIHDWMTSCLGQALHNIRSEPSVQGRVIGKIPSGSLFLGVSEFSNEEGIWITLHKQTLHSFDIPSYQPCYLSAKLFPSTTFVEKLK